MLITAFTWDTEVGRLSAAKQPPYGNETWSVLSLIVGQDSGNLNFQNRTNNNKKGKLFLT